MSKEGREGRHRRWSEEESEGGPWRRETRGDMEARGERREARDQLTHADAHAHAHAHAGDAHADDAQPTSARSRDSSDPFGPSSGPELSLRLLVPDVAAAVKSQSNFRTQLSPSAFAVCWLVRPSSVCLSLVPRPSPSHIRATVDLFNSRPD